MFGHSLGALLAYELARHVQRRGTCEVLRLFVSGAAWPWGRRDWKVTHLDDERFLEEVAVMTGLRHAALQEPRLRPLLLPALRADFQAQESYEPLPGPLLSAPLTVLRGRADRIVSRPEAEAWSSATTAPCVLTEFDGAHMYLLEHRDALLRLVENQLAEDAGIGSGR